MTAAQVPEGNIGDTRHKTIEDCVEFAMSQICSDTKTYYVDSFNKLLTYTDRNTDFAEFAGIIVWQPFEDFVFEDFFKLADELIEATVSFVGIDRAAYSIWKARG